MDTKKCIILGSLLLISGTAAVLFGGIVPDREVRTPKTRQWDPALRMVPVGTATGPSKVRAKVPGKAIPKKTDSQEHGLRRGRDEGGGGNGSVVFRQCFNGSPSGPAIIGLTNGARAERGLAALHESPVLDGVAEARARDMAEKEYFSHVSPTGERVSHVARRAGYPYRLVSENIAAGVFHSDRTILNCWMESAVHRTNILSPRVKEMGASVTRGRIAGAETLIAVQVFGLPSAPPSRAPFVPAYDARSTDPQTFAVADGLRGVLKEARQGLDDERESIERSLATLTDDPEGRERVNRRIRAYNEKADRYNASLGEIKAMKSSFDSPASDHEIPGAQGQQGVEERLLGQPGGLQ